MNHPAIYQQCVDALTAPDMQPGDTIDHGEFFRNLRKEHITKRYPGDDDDRPEYGCKLHRRQWKYWAQQRGLSVNLQPCVHSEMCSIALDPTGEDYFHVAQIDVGVINRCGALSSPFVAQYDPLSPNRCHFVILPLDGTVSKWMELAAVLDDPFPPVKKLPATPQEKTDAKAAYEEYRSCIDIRRWIRQPNRPST